MKSIRTVAKCLKNGMDVFIDDCSGVMLPNDSRTCSTIPGLNQVGVSRDESVPILPVVGAVSSRLTVFEVS